MTIHWTLLKSTKFYLALAAVLVVGGIAYSSYASKNAPPEYETALVTRGPLTQTVSAVGNIAAVDDLALRFEMPGTVNEVLVKEGQAVKAGQRLAALRLGELNAAVAQAAANLNQKLAGASEQDRAYYEAALRSSEASLTQAKVDADASVITAAAAVETARNNLKLAEGGDTSAIVEQKYDSAIATLQSTVGTLSDALTQADNILAVDNTFANEAFKLNVEITEPVKQTRAVAAYAQAKAQLNVARTMVLPLTTLSSHTDIDAAFMSSELALQSGNALMDTVIELVKAMRPIGSLTQSTLDAKKTTLEASRAAVTTKYTSVISAKQAIEDSRNSLANYVIAFNKAERDLVEAKADAQASVAIREAAYAQAKANYESKVIPPRSVDVAALRAAVSQAVAARDKAIIIAPIDGVVTKIAKKRGEFVSSSDVMVQLLSPHYEISVDIPETDVAKVAVNDKARITLDAFGSETELMGTVLSIDPGSTEVQDVVYYQVRVRIDDTDKPIKPGMTANVDITTDTREDALSVPTRAVRTRETQRYVRVLENGVEKEVVVMVGLRADDGRTEIVSGVTEGQSIILSVKK